MIDIPKQKQYIRDLKHIDSNNINKLRCIVIFNYDSYVKKFLDSMGAIYVVKTKLNSVVRFQNGDVYQIFYISPYIKTIKASTIIIDSRIDIKILDEVIDSAYNYCANLSFFKEYDMRKAEFKRLQNTERDVQWRLGEKGFVYISDKWVKWAKRYINRATRRKSKQEINSYKNLDNE